MDTENKTKPGAATQLQLDALKAIRESAFQRWDKRRGYEWQLSISIWTAFAAFSGLVLNKDFPITNSHMVARYVVSFGLLIFGSHFYYLWKMFSHTIGDAGILRWAEQEIYRLFLEDSESKAEMPRYVPKVDQSGKISASGFLMYPNLSRYGIVQVIITAILIVGAVCAVLARNPLPKENSAPALLVPTTHKRGDPISIEGSFCCVLSCGDAYGRQAMSCSRSIRQPIGAEARPTLSA